jgi:hypothetical protein
MMIGTQKIRKNETELNNIIDAIVEGAEGDPGA